MNSLASAYQDTGKLDLALPLFEETLKLRKAILGAAHPSTLTSMNNLASLYQHAGKLDLSLPLLEETLKLRKAKLGAEHPDTLHSVNDLATAYQAVGKLDLALPLLEETLKRRKETLGTDHPDTLFSMNNLAIGYRDSGQLDLALPLLQDAAAGMEKHQFQLQGANVVIGNLIAVCEQLQQFNAAEPWRRKWAAVVRQRFGADSIHYAAELALLGGILLKQEKWPDAETVLRECLMIREKLQPDVWTTFNTRALLGGALLGQKHYAEAEPLLLSGCQGMQEREGTIPAPGKPRLTEGLERLVGLLQLRFGGLILNGPHGAWRDELFHQVSHLFGRERAGIFQRSIHHRAPSANEASGCVRRFIGVLCGRSHTRRHEDEDGDDQRSSCLQQSHVMPVPG
jgi:tetratricopeptide (TPR) repeat protein